MPQPIVVSPHPLLYRQAVAQVRGCEGRLDVGAGARVARWNRGVAVVCVDGLAVLWIGRMVRLIDQATVVRVESGRMRAALLAGLHRLVPQPRPGSELAFYGLGELRGQQQAFVCGFDDAVRLLYNDGSLNVHLGPRGPAPQATYQLSYADGHSVSLSGARR